MNETNQAPKAVASTIPVWCAHDALADITSLIPNPRNPNTHPDSQIALLAKIIKNQGWRSPITVSKRSGFITKGHGRLLAAQVLSVAEVPIDYQDYANEAAEWADVIADNRIAELAERNIPLMKDLLTELDTGSLDMDLTGFDASSLEEMMTQTGNPYTTKISAPTYTPKGIKPTIDRLFDTTKTKKLIAEIDASSIPDDEKQFLKAAAQRHTVFNYEQVAEYYAQSSPEVQRLMEQSALIIIDFDAAIAGGFVKLSNAIREQYAKDYNKEPASSKPATENAQ